jgi:guanylate kinase
MARVFVITGPSGVGKGTLIRGLTERIPGLQLSVSATTRAPRPGERDGVDYYFLTREEFERRVRAGDFVEHADYAGRRYGTLRSELERRARAGEAVVLEIEVQGARQVRAAVPDAVLVFIAPPSAQALRERLLGRGTDDPDEVERRLRVAEEELRARAEFPHVVVNDELEDAVDALAQIVRAELAAPAGGAHGEPSGATTLEGQPGKAANP